VPVPLRYQKQHGPVGEKDVSKRDCTRSSTRSCGERDALSHRARRLVAQVDSLAPQPVRMNIQKGSFDEQDLESRFLSSARHRRDGDIRVRWIRPMDTINILRGTNFDWTCVNVAKCGPVRPGRVLHVGTFRLCYEVFRRSAMAQGKRRLLLPLQRPDGSEMGPTQAARPVPAVWIQGKIVVSRILLPSRLGRRSIAELAVCCAASSHNANSVKQIARRRGGRVRRNTWLDARCYSEQITEGLSPLFR
jgi:hypothetical protein